MCALSGNQGQDVSGGRSFYVRYCTILKTARWIQVPYVVLAFVAVGVARWAFGRIGRSEGARNIPRIGVEQGGSQDDVEWDDYGRDLLELREVGGLHTPEHVVLGRRSWDDKRIDAELQDTSYERGRSNGGYEDRFGGERYSGVGGDGADRLKPFDLKGSGNGEKGSVVN